MKRLQANRIFNASSTEAYGSMTSKGSAPEDCPMLPDTIFGVSMVYAELLGRYYHIKYGLDYRALRYPVIVSAQDGFKDVADFIKEMHFKAIMENKYECYVKAETKVPAIHVQDAVDATVFAGFT